MDLEITKILEMQKAPAGKFRVLCVDTFANPPYGEPFVLADCDDKEAAITLAKAHGAPMQPAYVYDSDSKCVYSA
jgi:hypothetical protein